MTYQPYYIVDFSASSCMFEIRINDIPVISMNIKGQASTNLPINYLIRKNGRQEISCKILPLFGDIEIDINAELKYKIIVFDVSNNGFRYIDQFGSYQSEPVDKNNPIPFITHNDFFNAEVPYELTSFNDAVLLSKVENAEEKLIAAGNELLSLIKEGNYDAYINCIAIREKSMVTSMYLNFQESKARIDNLLNDFKNGFIPMPIPDDVVILYCAYGKIATLRKIDGDSALSLFNEQTQEKLYLDVMFYMPYDSKEFKVI